ncbi:hypothetical protein COB11_06230 [Candidatus Aerophobetes bacterium]|uniref:UVR domain-containing protein n=1 Tax=Aerophobetes bacterium TaxID=2030807 RepID=A0A2A4YE17_UNCAE|nr:MAG: hypothetical protein COB11_06230 [Candidatus Aerophobetes bacterium]
MTDRPLECSHCKKTITTIYKEIERGVMNCSEMCEECPFLKKKLHGEDSSNHIASFSEKGNGLCCEKCSTSYETFSLDGTLGCPECYSIFSDLITKKLKTEGLIPDKMQNILNKNEHIHLHLGKGPNEHLNSTISTQVTDLNEALNDALQRENYEQAAELRDQIKQLVENTDDGC